MDLTAQQIHDNFRDGRGSGGLALAAAVLGELVAAYEQRAESLRRLTEAMAPAWQGGAAGAARRGAGPLAAEHALVSPDIAVAKDLAARQAGSFDEARSRVVPVPPMPPRPSPWDMVTGAATTYEEQVVAHYRAAENNVAVMRAYEAASSYNTDRMPTSYGTVLVDDATVGVELPSIATPPDSPPVAVAEPDQTDSPDAPEQPHDRTQPADSTPIPVAPPNQHPQDSTVPGDSTRSAAAVDLPGPRSAGTVAQASTDAVASRPVAGPATPAVPTPEVRLPHQNPSPVAEPQLPPARPAVQETARTSRSALPMGATGPVRREKDREHAPAPFLQTPDPDDLFGVDEITAPPVIGE